MQNMYKNVQTQYQGETVIKHQKNIAYTESVHN
jgi:hypothetical protein